MPYIKRARRDQLKPALIDQVYLHNPGELNYAITVLIRNYFHNHGENYTAINDVVGALDSAKLEFYRRVAIPLEDQKRRENGDVYG